MFSGFATLLVHAKVSKGNPTRYDRGRELPTIGDQSDRYEGDAKISCDKLFVDPSQRSLLNEIA